jgi:hypothetical protein
MRALAKRFKNCLATYRGQMDAGACAIYLWDDPATPAVCQVARHGCLSREVKGRDQEVDGLNADKRNDDAADCAATVIRINCSIPRPTRRQRS